MLNKELIKKNFKKSLNTYFDNAIVQKQGAKKLVELLPYKKYKNILEIGSYSGILTREINKNIDWENYLALDIIDDSKEYLKKINPEIKFLNEDIENFNCSEKFDLIIANMSLQWCNDFKSVIKKLKSMLASKGTLAITIFNQNNLFEIKESFNLSLNYLSIDELSKLFSPTVKFFDETVTLNFESPKKALYHLKLTGVNSIQKNNLTLTQIKEGLDILDKKFNNTLTYKPLYIID